MNGIKFEFSIPFNYSLMHILIRNLSNVPKLIKESFEKKRNNELLDLFFLKINSFLPLFKIIDCPICTHFILRNRNIGVNRVFITIIPMVFHLRLNSLGLQKRRSDLIGE